MTNTQLYLAIGVPIVVNFLALIGTQYSLKTYMDARFDSINSQLKFVVDHMMLHNGKIATLEERTKNL